MNNSLELTARKAVPLCSCGLPFHFSVHLRDPGVAYSGHTDLKAQEMTRSTQRVLLKGIFRFRSACPLVFEGGFHLNYGRES